MTAHMKVMLFGLVAMTCLLVGCASNSPRTEGPNAGMGSRGEDTIRPIPDPIQPVNRAMFQFNDRLYFWVFKPVASGYGWLVPKLARRGVRNFFSNLGMPIRTLNCLLQGQFGGAGTELGRFGINTTVGVAGFGDPAGAWGLEKQREDFGQTLGVWGAGPGFFINWPLLGPSSVRGTAGSLADAPLYAPKYVPGLTLYERVNNTSLRLGEYEDMKAGALDPYIAIRNAYHQHRQHLVRERGSRPRKKAKQRPTVGGDE